MFRETLTTITEARYQFEVGGRNRLYVDVSDDVEDYDTIDREEFQKKVEEQLENGKPKGSVTIWVGDKPKKIKWNISTNEYIERVLRDYRTR